MSLHTIYWVIFANFMVCVKFIHKNQIIMFHTLFWINLRIFDLMKITQYNMVITTTQQNNTICPKIAMDNVRVRMCALHCLNVKLHY